MTDTPVPSPPDPASISPAARAEEIGRQQQVQDLDKTENGQPQEPEPSREATSRLLDSAIVVASAAHCGQRDKQGLPVILHALRVALSLPFGEAQIVAVLHDVVEDTEMTVRDLRRGELPSHVVDAVDAITRRASEGYTDYIARVAENDLARVVKIADLCDNIARGEHYPSLRARYHRALAQLGATYSPPGAPVPAVDRSRSSPENALTPTAPSVRPVEGEDAALRKAAELVVVRMPRRPEADENGETPGVHLGPGAPIWDAIDALRAALAARAPLSARPTPETDR